MGDELQVTVIVSGIGSRGQVRAASGLGKAMMTGAGNMGHSGQVQGGLGLGSNLGLGATGILGTGAPSTTSAKPLANPIFESISTYNESIPVMLRTGTDDSPIPIPATFYQTPSALPSSNHSAMPSTRQLNLGSSNPTIPTLTEEIKPTVATTATALGAGAAATGSSSFDGIMTNPMSDFGHKTSAQKQIRAMQEQGVHTLDIPTFLRDQVN